MNFIDYIQHHPFLALIIGATHLLVAETLNATHVPEIVMQAFQILAWSVTITVGLISIYGFIKKKK